MEKYETMILIVAAVVCSAVLIVTYIKRKEIANWLSKPENKAMIEDLIRKAEERFLGTKEGRERLAWVLGKVVLLLPETLQPYIKVTVIIEVIQIIFDEIATYMPDGSRKAI